MRSNLCMVGLVGAIGLGMAAPAHAAGLFDDFASAFFGRPQRPAHAVVFDPLEVNVRPQRQHRRPVETSTKPKPPVVKLDPATEPHWYLRDPTLRRGDIVVTKNGVLVYQGRGREQHARADFTGLGSAKSGKGAWQQQLQAAAAGGRSFFRDEAPAASTVALTADASH